MKGTVTTILTVSQMRAKPEDTSELVSQVLFGETAEVVDKYKKDWIKIRMTYDGYEGWVDKKQFISSGPAEAENVSISLELFHNIFCDDKSTWITMGAELPSFDGMTCMINDNQFRFSGQAVLKGQLPNNGMSIEKIARQWMNAPYLWGGRTPAGIDCSGFTQVVFKCVGIPIPRDSRDQADEGAMIDFVASAQAGDLAFFSKESERISHVGIVLPDRQIIHASGKVRIDTLDHYGIFNHDIQEYTHRLKIIKRYL